MVVELCKSTLIEMEEAGVAVLSRKPRIWFPGAIYHIMNRGNRKSAIFLDDDDRYTYFDILEEARSKYPFNLHSYCLMTNHIHLLLETIHHPPNDIMKMLNSRYAQHFNRQHDLVGHVFQGRYDAKLIDSSVYFLEASRYIHLNPVEAEMVKSPELYLWSSYSAFLGNSPNPHVTTEKIFSYFPEPHSDYYREFVNKEKE